MDDDGGREKTINVTEPFQVQPCSCSCATRTTSVANDSEVVIGRSHRSVQCTIVKPPRVSLSANLQEYGIFCAHYALYVNSLISLSVLTTTVKF